jgi:hypothetical protein
MNEPQTARDYQDRAVRATYMVLIELVQICGAFRDKFVVIGGSVPWLLLPDAEPEHIGTIDVDLGLDPDALADGEYASMVELLEQRGYQRGGDLKPFQLRREVSVDEGASVSVIVDLLKPRGARGDRNKEKLLVGFRAQDADGIGVALRHHVTKRLEGVLPDGRRNCVDVLVASIPALLVMKGYALTGRMKNKDAYDIYYSIRNYPGGPRALAEECRILLQAEEQSSEPGVARKGYEQIAGKFLTADDYGPVTVRRFLEESDALGDMTAEQVQEDAYRQVSVFTQALATARSEHLFQ